MTEQHSRYYYTKLKEEEKEIYRKLYEAWQSLEPTVRFGKRKSLSSDIQVILEAVFWDNPELFYVDKENIVIMKNAFFWEVQGRFFWEIKEIKEKKRELDHKVQYFRQELARAKDRLGKCKSLHDMLAGYVTYNKGNMKENCNYTIYGALCLGRAVCEGIAKAYKLICDQEAIPCIVVAGSSINAQGREEGHAWNIVNIDKTKLHIDVTWDIAFTEINMEGFYFGMSDSEIERDHFWDRKLLPACEGISDGFLEIGSYRDMEHAVVQAVRKKESKIYMKFNRKFRSQQEILDLIKRYIEKNMFWYVVEIKISYINAQDKAVICFIYGKG